MVILSWLNLSTPFNTSYIYLLSNFEMCSRKLYSYNFQIIKKNK